MTRENHPDSPRRQAEPADAGDDAPPPSDALSTAVAEFLKAQKVTALDAYKDPGRRQQLLDFLRQRHLDNKQVEALKNNKPLGRALKRAMIILGQRPAAREATAISARACSSSLSASVHSMFMSRV